MGLTDTQQEIATAIKTVTTGWSPVATVSDIAEQTGLSEQAVRNNIDEVVENVTRIGHRKVGQTSVYFEKTNLMAEIEEDEPTLGTFNLTSTRGQAGYAAVRPAEEDSDFDLVIHWYDWNANRYDSYQPTMDEVSRIAEAYGPEPVAIKFWDPAELDEPIEVDSE